MRRCLFHKWPRGFQKTVQWLQRRGTTSTSSIQVNSNSIWISNSKEKMGFASAATPGTGARDATQDPAVPLCAGATIRIIREVAPISSKEEPCQPEFDGYLSCVKKNTMTIDMLDCEEIQAKFQKCMKDYRSTVREEVENAKLLNKQEERTLTSSQRETNVGP